MSAVGVAYKDLPRDVRAGDTLLLNDGQIVLDVVKVSGTRIETRVRVGGELSDRKGVNRQGGGISAPGALTDKDREDIRFAAAARRRLPRGVLRARCRRHRAGARRCCAPPAATARIVAKIERHEAIDNLAGIIEASDVVMVARGDLGVEMGYAELTGLQKTIIHQTPRAQSRGDHGHADDGVDDPESGADARRGERRRQRRHGRHRCGDAVGGDRRRALPGQGGAGHGAGHRRRREVPARRTRARASAVEGEFKGTEEAIAMAVMYTANHMQGARHRRAHRDRARRRCGCRASAPTSRCMPSRAHEATRRRVTLYRGVYPVIFDVTQRRDSTETPVPRAVHAPAGAAAW